MTDKLLSPAVEMMGLDRTTNRARIKVNPQSWPTVSRRMKPYKNLPLLFRPALEQVGDYVRGTMIPRTFEQEGPGWAQLSKKTVVQRMRDGYPVDHPILVQTGDLYDELTNKSHPKHIEIIKVGSKARIEIGGSSQKFIENQTGTGLPNLPPRPMIPGTGWLQIPDSDRTQMHRIIERALFDRLRRAV